MARIRTVKPEFWRHETLCEQPEATHMLAAALLNYADDYGYFNANPKLIAGEIYPLREPSVSIPESLRRLQTIGYIRLGTGEDGRRYGQVVEFEKHQRVSHATDSKISCLSIAWEHSGNTPDNIGSAPETFVPEQGKEQGKEQGTGNGKAATAAPPRKRSAKPSIEEPEGFAEFYAAFPKKVARPDAIKAYRQAVLKSTPVDIVAGAKRYASEIRGEPKKFIKGPGGWLRDERWKDDSGNVIRPDAFNSPEEIEAQRLAKERAYGQA